MYQNYGVNNTFMNEVSRVSRSYTIQQIYQLYNDVCTQLESIEANFNHMTQFDQQQARQAHEKLKFQHGVLEFILGEAQQQQQNRFPSQQGGYNRYNSGSVSLNTHNEPPLTTRTVKVGFGNNQQPTSRHVPNVRPSIVTTTNSYGHSNVQNSTPVSRHIPSMQQQTPQPQQQEGVYMCAKVEGGLYPYATTANKLTTDGTNLGFVLEQRGNLIQDALVNISVNPDLLYYAFKSDNGYTPILSSSSNKEVDELEPMKQLILTLSETTGAPADKVNYLITDIIITLLKREGVRGVDNIISKDELIQLDDWIMVDKYITGEDTQSAELATLNKISKKLNQVKFSKHALYSFLYEYITIGYSFVEGNFISNLVEVVADVRHSFEFLNFLNLSNFDTFKLTEDANPTLYSIVSKAFEEVKESAFLMKNPAKFCKITLFLRDENGFEYSLVVDHDRVNGDVYYINNSTRSVIVNQGVSDDDKQGK